MVLPATPLQRNQVLAKVSFLVAQVTSVHKPSAAFGKGPIANKNDLEDIHSHGQVNHGGHSD